MTKNDKYETLESVKHGTFIIRLTGGQFDGIEFRYGRVAFDTNDEGTLNFDYFVEKDEYNDLADDDVKKSFHQYIGDILVEMIQSSLDEGNELVCAGGT